MNATIGHLRFPDLNGATSPLLGVSATEGNMNSLGLKMDGNDRRAKVSNRMDYQGLRIEDARERNTLGLIVMAGMNLLVRNADGSNATKGKQATITLERRRDRAVFNYMRSRLRDGAKAVLLPDLPKARNLMK